MFIVIANIIIDGFNFIAELTVIIDELPQFNEG